MSTSEDTQFLKVGGLKIYQYLNIQKEYQVNE